MTGAAASSQSRPNWLSTTMAGISSAGCTSRMPRETRVSTRPLPIGSRRGRRPARRSPGPGRRWPAPAGSGRSRGRTRAPGSAAGRRAAPRPSPRSGTSRCPALVNSRPIQTRKPTTIASRTRARRKVPNARSTIRTTPDVVPDGRRDQAGARCLMPRSSATSVRTQAGMTSRPSTKLSVPATPRIWLATNWPAPATAPLMAPGGWWPPPSPRRGRSRGPAPAAGRGAPEGRQRRLDWSSVGSRTATWTRPLSSGGTTR